MLICGMKLTHDGTVALIKDDCLIFSIEMEKLNNNNRYQDIKNLDVVYDLLRDFGYEPGDIDYFAVDGWSGLEDSYLKTRSGEKELNLEVAPYRENKLTDNVVQEYLRSGLIIKGKSYPYLSYTHAAGHIFSTWCTSPFAKKNEGAFSVVWDGGMYPRLYYLDPGTQSVKNYGPLFWLIGNVYAIFSAHFNPFIPKRDISKEYLLSIPGKVMAYIAKGEKKEEIVAALDNIYRTEFEASLEFAYTFSRGAKRYFENSDFSDVDILMSFNTLLERLFIKKLSEKLSAMDESHSRNLCFTGGCALNIIWNTGLRNSHLFNEVWVPPFPNDTGSAIGAACCALYSKDKLQPLKWSVYSGPNLNKSDVEDGWKAVPFSLEKLATHLHDTGEPVVFLNGRAELGPRALGNRSILAPANSPYMKGHLNEVKIREDYRPVSPICLEDKAPDVFEPGCPDPYMLFLHFLRDEWKEKVPAIMHLDGSARLQTINEEQNPAVVELLKHYERVSGIPLLCNTSANYNGSGFFPDVHSAMKWGRVNYIWCDGILYENIVKTDTENEELLNKEKEELLALLIEEEKNRERYAQKRTIVPIKNKKKFRMSFSQERLWFLDIIDEEKGIYNQTENYSIEGALDIQGFEKSINEIIHRHKTLRTNFEMDDEKPIQVVHDKRKVKLILIDLSGVDLNDREYENQRLLHENNQNAFDLTNDMLIRNYLIKIGQEKYVYSLTMHHIITDGWSMGIFHKELLSLYNTYVNEKEYQLEPLPTQYADFAEWQREWLNREKLKSQIDYWKNQLQGASHFLELPTDKQRPPIQTFKGSNEFFEIDPEILNKLKMLSKESEVTLYMTLLAAYAVLLFRYSRQEEILIGTPAPNRNRKEIENIIGFFVNTLVPRFDFSMNPSFKELLDFTRQVMLDAYTNQDLPFEELVKILKPERSLSHNPIFQVMFALQKASNEKMEVSGLNLKHLEIETATAKFDLTLYMTLFQEELVGSLEYNTDLFHKETINQMVGHFKNLLSSICDDPQTKIKALSLLSHDEKRKVLIDWNRRDEHPVATHSMVQLFEEKAEQKPDGVAVVFHDRQITYKELNKRSGQLANYLRGKDVQPEKMAGILLPRSIEMVIGMLGVLKAGGAYVPLDPEYPKDRLRYMISDANMSIIITNEALMDHLFEVDKNSKEMETPDRFVSFLCIDKDQNEIMRQPELSFSSGISNRNLAYVLYTSGSTGKPKGVAIEHQSVLALINWAKSSFPQEALSTVLASTSICFDLSVFELFVPLSLGDKVVIIKNVVESLHLLPNYDITLINTVPSAMTEIVNNGEIPCSVHTVNLAGEPLKRDLVKKIYQTKTVEKVINLYGPSEDTTYSTIAEIDRMDDGAPTIGVPISNTKIYLLDENYQAVPIRVPGELYIGGSGLSRGYLNRPGLTSRKFIPSPFDTDQGLRIYKTGDISRYRFDSNIEFLGRSDHQVKIRGYRIELGEIEFVLTRHPKIAESVIITKEMKGIGDTIIGFYVLKEGARLDTIELRNYLRDKLSEYMIPGKLKNISEIPLTPNGKISRQALLALDIKTEEGTHNLIHPNNKIEQRMLAIWKDLLNVEHISVNENFFEIGGHSLLLLKVQKRITEVFNRSIPVTDLFRYPTIKLLARYLNHQATPMEKAPVQSNNIAVGPENRLIAIIGMAGRFPGSENIEAYWQNVKSAKESVTSFTVEALRAKGIDPALLLNPNYVKSKAILNDIDLFDASFFNISPKEAQIMDPQHRLFMECAFEALENAGYGSQEYRDNVGLYCSVGANTYLLNNLLKNNKLLESLDYFQALLASEKDYLSTRISYKLNLNGPSATIQTACSSSLVAIHFACQSLVNKECDLALAGGISVDSNPVSGYLYEEGGIASPDGHCKAFDKDANGSVPGSGYGIIVLKRLQDALEDNDHIDAVIRGSAINNDGSLKVGYTAPSVEAQAKVILAAQKVSQTGAESISYIETHGTGTMLGDPIEIEALSQAFRSTTGKNHFCAIGSVKTNIGHLDTASGVAGVIKTAQALKNRQIPPSINYSSPNPKIDFSNSPFYVNTGLKEWKTQHLKRRAGVSSFGIGGTNAHIILEQAPKRKALNSKNSHELFLISARTENALSESAENLKHFLKNNPDSNLRDIAYTLQVGRQFFDHRRMLVAESVEDAIRQLDVPPADGHQNEITQNDEIDPDFNPDTGSSFQPRDASFLNTLGKLWLKGVNIDWKKLNRNRECHRIPLPPYPYERKRYWIEPDTLIDKGIRQQVSKSDMSHWPHEPYWKETGLDLPLMKLQKEFHWLVFADSKGYGEKLSIKLKNMNQNVFIVQAGEKFTHPSDDIFELNPNHRDDFFLLANTLYDRGIVIDKVVYLWPLTDKDLKVNQEKVLELKNSCFYNLLFLSQALAGKKPSSNIQIMAVSNHLHKIDEEDRIEPLKSILAGPMRVIPMEHPNMECLSIDINLSDSSEKQESTVEEILREATSNNFSDKFVALRNQKRYRQDFKAVDLPESGIMESRQLRNQGVYLITGGLGGLGFAIARYLAESVNARLILVGRSEIPEKEQWGQVSERQIEEADKIDKIQALEKLGAKVLYLSADVSDLSEMGRIIEKAKEKFGTINGLVHAAGVPGNGITLLKTQQTAQEVFRPKIDGTLVLDQLLQSENLEFVILFSSISAILGGIGQVDYCAANAFLDAFATANFQKYGCRIHSINWDTWNETGMALDLGLPDEFNKMVLDNGITTNEGIHIFNAVLNHKKPQLVVSTVDLKERRNQKVSIELLSEKIPTNRPLTLHERPNLKTEYMAPEGDIEKKIVAMWQDLLGIYDIGIYDNFFELGGDSLLLIQLHARLKEIMQTDISVVELFEYPTINDLVEYFSIRPDKKATPSDMDMSRTAAIKKNGSTDIAIIGISGRFPGASDVDEFWNNIANGKESITFFEKETMPVKGQNSAVHVNAGAVIDDIDKFDAMFFGYNRSEAELTDPQQRLLLEVAYNALENAGYTSNDYKGAIGVYTGTSTSTYLINNLASNLDLFKSTGEMQAVIGNTTDHASTRISYKLNLKGPSINVNTACSTSLVAIHQACKSLLSGECDMALAGAANIKIPQDTGYFYEEGGMVSPDGHCRVFDTDAKGTIFGNGVGVVVLKRVDNALEDGDFIHALIKGSAINNDGNVKMGYTAPSKEGQSKVIMEAHEFAGIDPETISYVEAHGTGTTLGDPIEVEALKKAFGSRNGNGHFCAIGSVKTNIGHLDAAAGIAGLIKTVQALKHSKLPPTLHYNRPNPRIDFDNSPFYVNTALKDWHMIDNPKRAGVSSFGIGGTNAHVLLEEAPERNSTDARESWKLVPLSAKTQKSLDKAAVNLAGYMEVTQDLNFSDVAYTLQVGRAHFNHRQLLMSRDIKNAVSLLKNNDEERVFHHTCNGKKSKVAFLFSGREMASMEKVFTLYQEEPLFKETIDRCCSILKPLLNLDLREIMFPGLYEKDTDDALKCEFWLGESIVFIIEYAMASLFRERGVTPSTMIGHGIGEYAAACLAGVFSVEDALKLVNHRAALTKELKTADQIHIPLSEEKVLDILGNCRLVEVNAPSHCVVSGESKDIEALKNKLVGKGLENIEITRACGIEEEKTEDLVNTLTQKLETIKLTPPRIPFISSATGNWITNGKATSLSYWIHHIFQTIRFSDGFEKIVNNTDTVVLEAGLNPAFSNLLRRQNPILNGNIVTIADWFPNQEKAGQVETKQVEERPILLDMIGQLWLHGVSIDWVGFNENKKRKRVPLPGYPFERKRYWIEPGSDDNSTEPGTGNHEKISDMDQWIYTPSWKRWGLDSSMAEEPGQKGCWVMFADSGEIGIKLKDKLEKRSIKIITVKIGDSFNKVEENTYILNPKDRKDYDLLVGAFQNSDIVPTKIIHLWNVKESPMETSLKTWGNDSDIGFYSLLYLAQALEKVGFDQPVQVDTITNNMQDILGTDICYPEKATILGATKVISQEFQNIICRSIDFDTSQIDKEKIIDQIEREVFITSSHRVIAYRGNHRWIEHHDRVHIEDSEKESKIRQNGVYLLTGGMGNIGLAIAGYMAEKFNAKMVLTGRAKMPDREKWKDILNSDIDDDEIKLKIVKINEMEKSGAEVMLAHVDVADTEKMKQLLNKTYQRFGTLNGVIHLAGALNESSLIPFQDMRKTTCEKNFKPKIEGIYVLNEILQGKKLDFCVLFSSLSSVLGGLGNIAYSASNNFMNQFADYYSNQINEFPWISISWDSWQFKNSHFHNTSLMKYAMSADEGLKVFERILSSTSLSQWVVSTGDLNHRYEKYIKINNKTLISGTQEKSVHPRPELSNSYVPPCTETQITITEIWQKFIGISKIGIHDNYFELGGDSLLAIQIVSKISDIFSMDLTIITLFEKPSVFGFAEEINAMQIEKMDESELEELLQEMNMTSDKKVEKTPVEKIL